MRQTLAAPYALVYEDSPLMRYLALGDIEKIQIDVVPLHYHVSNGFSAFHFKGILAQSQVSHTRVF